MNALDASHLDIGCGRGARDGRQGKVAHGGHDSDGFRHSLNNLFGKDDAEVVIGNQADGPARFFFGVAQDNGAGLGNGQCARGDHSLKAVQLVVIEIVVAVEIEAGRNPATTEIPTGHQSAKLAISQRCANRA